MGQVIDFYSRKVIKEGLDYGIENDMLDLECLPKNDKYSDRPTTEISAAAEKSSTALCGGDFVPYDPQMPIAVEIFTDLDKSVLLDGCWVPLSWDKNGIVVLIDDPQDEEKKAAVKTELRTEWVIFKAGTKKDIEAFINQSFNQLEIDDFLSALMWDTKPLDVNSLVNIIIAEAYLKGACEVLFESIAASEKGCVWFLMDGVLQEYMTLPDDVTDDIIKRIQSMANLDVENSDLPKVGHIRFKRDGLPEFKVTVTTYPADGPGERVVLKIPDSKNS